MILIGIERQGSIKARLADLKFKEMQLSIKLQDLAQYSANISDGILTVDEIATSPAALNQMHAHYFNKSLNYAMHDSYRKLPMAMAMHQRQMGVMPDNSDIRGMNINARMIHQQLFKQSLEKMAKQEEKKLHVAEKKIQAEKLKVESQIKMLETELKSVEQGTDKDIAQSAPKFGLQG